MLPNIQRIMSEEATEDDSLKPEEAEFLVRTDSLEKVESETVCICERCKSDFASRALRNAFNISST